MLSEPASCALAAVQLPCQKAVPAQKQQQTSANLC